ncbi:acyl-CoA dehydrogenase [Deferrisoma camini]|uniref:acyl-CoA dehydrogenase n=1 Tax=Deferrisoma camini TaxID=1035120 RepID=UPI00046D2372|nr:acyl-CoA dehydrogenase [Deferrisoma camini]
MNFELDDVQTLVRDTARRFAQEEVAPLAAEMDKTATFRMELVKQMGELGFMGVAIPEQYGGGGMDYRCYSIVVEELSAVCASTGVVVSAHSSLCCDPIYRFGTEEQKKKYLVPLASGQMLGCLGLTEPQAGTDAGAVRTTAVLDGDEWVLNGTKIFITNGGQAGVAVVIASTDRSAKHRGLSAFIVPADAPGYKVAKEEHKLGIRASSTAELVFEDCRIPKENLLGRPGEGFKIAMQTLDGGRIGIASQAVGIARGAMEQAIAYAKERQQFGQPIANFQAIQWKLADMATEIDAARLLTWRAAWMKDQGFKNYSREAAMAKLFASDVAMKATREAVQVFGGYGYIDEYPVERYYRDAKITEIYEGTSEVQRMVISRALLRD